MFNHYLQVGSQTGDVLVSFNGGPDQLVKRYSVPSGATNVKVKFRYYNASNNWYWVIDDLKVG